jgi:serine/threonine-protein kinase
MLRLHTFGGCVVSRDGTRLEALSAQRKGLALLAMIASAGAPGISRETALAALWPESDEERARTSLKQLVHSLRQQSGERGLLLPSAILQLNPDVITSDVAEFRDAVRRGDHDAAVSLYVGPFLDGFYLRGADGLEQWAATERGPLALDFLRSLETLAERATTRGDVRLAVELWRRVTHAEPLSARGATGLMRALDSAGDRAAALQHARVYQLLVQEELGGAPEPSVSALVARLQRGDSLSISTFTSNPKVDPIATTAPTSRRVDAPAPLSGARPSVAVLPFTNTSGDAADEPFSDGLTDELIGALGKVAGLKVAGRTSTFALRGRAMGARAIAETLGVTTVLEGSVRRSGSRLKVSAQLVSAADDAVLWAETYARELADVFAVQEEITRAIVAALRVELVGSSALGGRTRLVGTPPASLEAYELYLKGRHLWNTRLSSEGLRLALSYFEQAVAHDPMYARAYAGISDAHALLAIIGHGRAHDGFGAAKTAAHKALALDDTLAEAHVSLGHVLFVYDFAWDAAERTFRRAIALDPANPAAHYIFAVCLQDQGRFDEAIAEVQAARALDPLSSQVGNLLGRVYVNARRPDDAIRSLREALELNPQSDLAYQQLGHAYLQKGMRGEALTALRQAAGLSGARDAAHLAYAHAVTGAETEARRILAELCNPTSFADVLPFHIAMVYAGLGQRDEAFGWLERGYTERAAFMDGVKITPAFDALHGDSRWASLLQRMGLEP